MARSLSPMKKSHDFLYLVQSDLVYASGVAILSTGWGNKNPHYIRIEP